MRGTKCGVQDSATELQNVTLAHLCNDDLATRQVQKVCIYRLVHLTRNNVKIEHESPCQL